MMQLLDVMQAMSNKTGRQFSTVIYPYKQLKIILMRQLLDLTCCGVWTIPYIEKVLSSEFVINEVLHRTLIHPLIDVKLASHVLSNTIP
jgi:hypothetical protein